MVADEYYEAGTTDFYPVLTGVVAENPDAIEFGASPPGDVAMMTKQVRELGYEGPLYQIAMTALSILLDVAGPENVWGICSNEPDWTSDVYPAKAHALYQEWQEMYPGEPMDRCPPMTYSAVMFYAAAIEEAGSIDPDEVMKVLDDPDFRFDVFFADDVALGGMETFGIRRHHPLNCDYGEIIDAEHVYLSKSVIISEVP